jgi:site-specific DNA-methyltransferase (adenine-specific)
MCIVDPYDEYDLNIYTGSFLEDGFDKHMKEVWNIPNNRFQLILGNPPYQKSDGGGGKGSSAIPIYNLFTEKSLKITDRLLYITPSRWFITGKGLDGFRKMMIDNKGLKLIKHFPGNGSDLFGDSVDIKGGVSYFLIDNKENDKLIINGKEINKSLIKKVGYVFTDHRIYSIVSKILINSKKFLSDKVESSNFFGKIISGKKYLRNASDCVEYKSHNTLKCFVSKSEGFIKYVNSDFVKNKGINKYKILTTKGTSVGKIGNTFLANPYEVCSETYLVMLFDDKESSEFVIKYFDTDLFKFLFKISNNTQNSSKKTYSIIPFPDYNTDEDLYKFYKFSEEDIEFIKDILNK